MAVDPSCPASPSGSGSAQTWSHMIGPITALAMIDLATICFQARRTKSLTLRTVDCSFRTMTASAVSSCRSDLCRPIAIPSPGRRGRCVINPSAHQKHPSALSLQTLHRADRIGRQQWG